MPCFVRFNLFKNIHSLSTFYIQSIGLGVVRITDPQGMILGHFRSAVVITFALHKARLFPWRKSASIGNHRRKSTVRWIRLCTLGFGAGKWGKLGNDKCFLCYCWNSGALIQKNETIQPHSWMTKSLGWKSNIFSFLHS